MKKNLSTLAVTGALLLGGFLGFSLNERSSAQQSGNISSNPSSIGTPENSSGAGYSSGRARTESENNTVKVVKDRQDGLVYISVASQNESSPEAQLRQQLEQQFGFSGTPDTQEKSQTATGSGFFVDSQGDIITNNHVVDGASEISIRLHGSKDTYKAKVIALAPEFDLALIRPEGVPQSRIQPMPLGDSNALDVGLKAVAMGAPFNLDFSVSEGIISSLERKVGVGTKGIEQSVIQTDAAINPGNSGGPLLNSAGEVIGVNTQIITGGISQNAGVGFAIPINTVKQLLPQLKNAGGKALKTPSLGIQFTDIAMFSTEQKQKYNLPESGALIQRVYPNSPAASARLQAGSNGAIQQINESGQSSAINTDGDVITAIDGQKISQGDDLRSAILGKQIGDTVQLSITKEGKTREVSVKLSKFDFASR